MKSYEITLKNIECINVNDIGKQQVNYLKRNTDHAFIHPCICETKHNVYKE